MPQMREFGGIVEVTSGAPLMNAGKVECMLRTNLGSFNLKMEESVYCSGPLDQLYGFSFKIAVVASAVASTYRSALDKPARKNRVHVI